MGKCNGCLFRGEYQDMGASTPVCTRETEFLDAIKAINAATPCRWYITKADVKAIQDGATAVMGASKTVSAREAEILDAIRITAMAGNNISNSIKNLIDSLKAFSERGQEDGTY